MFAHEIVTEGSVTAVLHIDPDDQPVVGERASLSVSFGSPEASFPLSEYALSLTLTKAGNVIATKTDIDADVTLTESELTFPFTFTEAGSYVLQINATQQQKTDHALGSAHFDIPFTVGESGEETTGHHHHEEGGSIFASPHFFHYLIFAIALGAGLWLVLKKEN